MTNPPPLKINIVTKIKYKNHSFGGEVCGFYPSIMVDNLAVQLNAIPLSSEGGY
jgi:hypothetical protein